MKKKAVEPAPLSQFNLERACKLQANARYHYDVSVKELKKGNIVRAATYQKDATYLYERARLVFADAMRERLIGFGRDERISRW